MKTNQTALIWQSEISGCQTYRDYPIDEESLILSMIDVIWTAPHCSDIPLRHNWMKIGLCLEGNGIIHIDGREIQTFVSGSVVIIPKGIDHICRNMGQLSTRWRYIAVNEDLLTQDAPTRCRIEIGSLLRRMKTCGIFLLDHAMTKEIIWLIQRMFEIKSGSANAALAELESIILVILSRIARDPDINTTLPDGESSTPHVIDPALSLVAEAYHQDIKVLQMARACAMSESHFRKVFALLMGVSPLEYLNRYRIKKAMYLLQTTTSPISRIAEECGFPTVTTFNRNFQRYSNVSPSQWRNENGILGQVDH